MNRYILVCALGFAAAPTYGMDASQRPLARPFSECAVSSHGPIVVVVPEGGDTGAAVASCMRWLEATPVEKRPAAQGDGS